MLFQALRADFELFSVVFLFSSQLFELIRVVVIFVTVILVGPKDFGVLLTGSLLWQEGGASCRVQYLQSQLAGLPAELMQQFLGLRTMGYEAKEVRPVASQFQSEEMGQLRALMGKMGEGAGEFLGRELTYY